MKPFLPICLVVYALVSQSSASAQIVGCKGEDGNMVLREARDCPGAYQSQATVRAPSLPAISASPAPPLVQVAPDPFGQVVKAPIDTLVLTERTKTFQPSSYLDRFAKGAVTGFMFVVLGFLYLAVLAIFRRFKAQGKWGRGSRDFQMLLGIVIFTIVIGMAIYPPFQVHVAGMTRSVGYDWIFLPSLGSAASIDIAMLVTQWATVLGVGALVFIYLVWSAKSKIQDQSELQRDDNSSSDLQKKAPEEAGVGRYLQAGNERRGGVELKAQAVNICPHCGGPRRDGICWSCGVRG